MEEGTVSTDGCFSTGFERLQPLTVAITRHPPASGWDLPRHRPNPDVPVHRGHWQMLELPRGVYDGLVDHALEGAPEEVCGVLGGRYGEETSQVRSARRAANVADPPETEYAIDPEEQLALIESIEADGDEVVGFYHSHPTGPAGPSETDAARATWPGLSYVIVVLNDGHPFVGSWRWNADGERFDQEVVGIRNH